MRPHQHEGQLTSAAAILPRLDSKAVCFCGRLKGARYAFCVLCFKTLPGKLRAGLYATGEQFERNYRKARAHAATARGLEELCLTR